MRGLVSLLLKVVMRAGLVWRGPSVLEEVGGEGRWEKKGKKELEVLGKQGESSRDHSIFSCSSTSSFFRETSEFQCERDELRNHSSLFVRSWGAKDFFF